jgi:IPT/TIG domain
MSNPQGPLLPLLGFTRSVTARRRNPAPFSFCWRLRPLRWLPAVAALALFVPLANAQAIPHIQSVSPADGKVNVAVTLTGDHLGKSDVVGVFLSDAKTDHKADIVEQSEEKIVMKVPKVQAGDYNVSVQSGDKILILPVRFTVDQ